jgi:hypothetical protein
MELRKKYLAHVGNISSAGVSGATSGGASGSGATSGSTSSGASGGASSGASGGASSGASGSGGRKRRTIVMESEDEDEEDAEHATAPLHPIAKLPAAKHTAKRTAVHHAQPAAKRPHTAKRPRGLSPWAESLKEETVDQAEEAEMRSLEGWGNLSGDQSPLVLSADNDDSDEPPPDDDDDD